MDNHTYGSFSCVTFDEKFDVNKCYWVIVPKHDIV